MLKQLLLTKIVMMILKDVLKLPTALLCTVKKNIAHISIILLSIFCQINLSAQEKFDLEQRSGHFYDSWAFLSFLPQ